MSDVYLKDGESTQSPPQQSLCTMLKSKAKTHEDSFVDAEDSFSPLGADEDLFEEEESNIDEGPSAISHTHSDNDEDSYLIGHEEIEEARSEEENSVNDDGIQSIAVGEYLSLITNQPTAKHPKCKHQHRVTTSMITLHRAFTTPPTPPCDHYETSNPHSHLPPFILRSLRVWHRLRRFQL